MNPTTAVIIPFRDRGRDPLRVANLQTVQLWWSPIDFATVVDDGRTGDAQFNRSAAYNRGALLRGDADVLIFAESDMLVPAQQIWEAVRLAAAAPGLVVPFTEYHYLDPDGSQTVRDGAAPSSVKPERIKSGGRSIGAVNVISTRTLDLVGGYTERTEGNWYDDDIMRHAFEVCAGPTRWVPGPAWHLYHLPGWTGEHLTTEDREATARNKRLWRHVRRINDPVEIRKVLHS